MEHALSLASALHFLPAQNIGTRALQQFILKAGLEWIWQQDKLEGSSRIKASAKMKAVPHLQQIGLSTYQERL